ncbi:MAG: hypothetical protein MJE68_08605, partial [Proteobacteria bacterium]|nr:hypothetical protein [Pseudomonadota bacterium]
MRVCSPSLPGLEEFEVLDVSTLLNAVDEVLNLSLCHFATEVGIVSENFSQGVRLYKLWREMGEGERERGGRERERGKGEG